MKDFIIFDIETDGLLDTVTKIHCLSYIKYNDSGIIETNTITNYDEIKLFFEQDTYFVGHNIIRYDIPVLNKILGINITKNLIDTLGLSWYLYPENKKHNLEYWGEYIGIDKIKISDWINNSVINYIERCEIDVKINLELFIIFYKYLINLYNNFEKSLDIINYINFKLRCLLDQEIVGITIEENKCKLYLEELKEKLNVKINILSDAMPKNLGKILKKKPVKFLTKNEVLSKAGIKWKEELSKLNLKDDEVSIVEKPNPQSDKQVKDWLYSLGWIPITFGLNKVTNKKVEKISLPFGGGICPSVKKLYEKEPKLIELENFFIIKHRIGIFKSYLKNIENSKVYSTAHGFTNTLRLTHSEPIVNLPKLSVYYGNEIRSVLTVPSEDYIMCGSDISGLEDNTKQHYIFYYDPEYVKEMRIPGFCPHLDIGILANLITKEEANFYKYVENLSEDDRKKTSEEDVTKYKKIKNKRFTAKTTNFSATYGAGPPKIAETAKISIEEGKSLHKIYWTRNWAVKQIAKDTFVKEVPCSIQVTTIKDNGNIIVKEKKLTDSSQKWLYNPTSKFWIYLKSDKDKFSTLNQSTGVYIFDLWIKIVKNKIKNLDCHIVMQYHDEILLVFHKNLKDIVSNILKTSMKEVNNLLKLNIDISISTSFGQNYSECH